MDDENLLTIGALAARTGLSLKTIRFYSDRGIVPATCHSPAGYRLYDRADDDQLASWIHDRLEVADDSRVTRYWQLVAIINGWTPLPDLEPVFTWFRQAIRTRLDSRS
ncbi:MerR family DNA-binding transcriptional regulator [Nocardia cyriacigeorgica]|uniref:MerR family DNA-binding transcriptional regulator n=1 Tax=Nocardia cyriacigeorgica TaxID=135487 RepID=UPI001893E903|nr:MerR family DNA-binding transcriptional regulator [Nocardia cyriacigeorgica]MBF6157776.1 MerR family DNA-binding transcriptional regulator [Nocardia cyriacigeorgica]MBF6196748.1 MerR family DNA-binding transcriptional regulator [Nocardia cyriacigeorgica]